MRKSVNSDPLTNEQDGAEHHPSYGMIEISRFNCTPPQNFFGSAGRHHSGICLRIHRAKKCQSLTEDHYFAESTIIEVNMAAAQYADMICSPNIGDGIPCTIRMLNAPKEIPQGKLLEACPEESVRQRIQGDFEAKMKAIAANMEELQAKAGTLLEKPNVLKADKEAVADLVHTLICQIKHSMPFIQQQFDEAMDATITNVKADLELFVAQLSRSLGDPRLAAELQINAQGLLPEPSKPNEPASDHLPGPPGR